MTEQNNPLDNDELEYQKAAEKLKAIFNVAPVEFPVGKYVVIYRKTGAVADDADGNYYNSPAAAWKALYYKAEHETGFPLEDTKSINAKRFSYIDGYSEAKKTSDKTRIHDQMKQIRMRMPNIEYLIEVLTEALKAGMWAAADSIPELETEWDTANVRARIAYKCVDFPDDDKGKNKPVEIKDSEPGIMFQLIGPGFAERVMFVTKKAATNPDLGVKFGVVNRTRTDNCHAVGELKRVSHLSPQEVEEFTAFLTRLYPQWEKLVLDEFDNKVKEILPYYENDSGHSL